jgi:hypothetical protein
MWQFSAMSTVTLDLQATLNELDAEAASKLERLVRDALALAKPATKPAAAVVKNGWPAGFFEETAGRFVNEPFDFPADPPLEPTANW